ncbi:hypothetical protein, conserved [Plasmodium gonderi]|uniref:Lipase maturation factor 2 n=1 Tax=Plasmodium gonderi TaxID=77519 RepID=A0A1Y1JD94_PLAGO|nr:hypothetical protein, conserved [Plasmodium gonderi]GAW79658.1 hypothetical protein, conserved [Plasmodium gonderi]
MDIPYSCSSMSHKINENNNNDTFKLKRKHCVVISCFIFYIFFLSTANNLDKYLHLRTTHYILTYSNLLYFISFYSLNGQVEFLIGVKNGILPVDKHIKEVRKKLKSIDFFLVHHIVHFVYQFWKYVIKNGIKVNTFCKVGMLLSIVNFLIQKNIRNDFFRIAFSYIFFVCLFILHLCFKIAMRDFMVFQCDILMNELGFLLTFLCLSDSYHLRHSNTLVICTLRLIAFKILFNSAVHKFVYNGSMWIQLEAFQNLFYCQPIPSILSHIANCIFDKKLICFLVIISELLLSWFIFCSSNLRVVFFTLFVIIQITFYIICNYIFFSYICLILFFSSLDDSILNLFPYLREIPAVQENSTTLSIQICFLICFIRIVILLFYFLIVLINLVPFTEQWNMDDLKCFHLCYHIFYGLYPLNICNSYAMLTYTRQQREEIVIEELHKVGKRHEWKILNFNYKPGNLNKIGPILWLGHVPRLEWKFYFFPDHIRNENYERSRYPIYFCSFLKKLYNREENLISLFDGEQMRQMPYMLRLTFYNYKMSMEEREEYEKPEGESNLTGKSKWEFGKYWLRRKVRILVTLKRKEA